MKYESNILKRLIDTYGVVGNPRYLSEIIKEFIVRGKELYPQLFTYQADWLAHIDEFGLTPDYVVSYTGQQIYAPHTKERPVKRAILKGSTKYRDIDTGEFLETFEEGRNLELVSVKMPVLTTTGKNLFDIEKVADINNWVLDKTTAERPYGYYEFSLKPNTTYTFSRKSNVRADEIYACFHTVYGVYNEHGGIIHPTNDKVNRTTVSFTTDSNGKIFLNGYGLRSNFSTFISLIEEAQIEEGSVATPYEPYKTNILTVNEPNELRGIGDVKDTLDGNAGELTQRIGEIVLDGTHATAINGSNDTHQRFTINCFDFNIGYNKPLLCDKYPCNGDVVSKPTIFTNANSVVVCIEKSKLSEFSVNGFKQWLAQNPLTIQYQLATESIKTVDLTVKDQNDIEVSQLSSFNGGTHFTTSSQEGSLHPTIIVDVVTDLEETLNLCSMDGNTI